MSILARHIHQPPDQPHRLVATDGQHLRCLDCKHTLEIPAAPSAKPTSANPRHPRALEQCPRHVGEFADRCGRCRSEQIEAQARPAPRPTADVTAGAAAARAALLRQEHSHA